MSEQEEPETRPELESLDSAATAVPDPRDRRKSERRSGFDRRQGKEPSPDVERREDDRREADRRRGPPVPEEYRAPKRQINEYPLASDELQFINAINAYKQKYNKPFPTWSEVLHVVKALGYRKAADRSGDP